jgi:hypothetical protein
MRNLRDLKHSIASIPLPNPSRSAARGSPWAFGLLLGLLLGVIFRILFRVLGAFCDTGGLRNSGLRRASGLMAYDEELSTSALGR